MFALSPTMRTLILLQKILILGFALGPIATYLWGERGGLFLLVTGIGALMLQWGQSIYLSRAHQSTWHRRYATGVGFYVFSMAILALIVTPVNHPLVIDLLFGLFLWLIPILVMGWYAFFGAKHIPQTHKESSNDPLLDDDF